MVNCPNCGHTVPSSQRFCGSCGADVEASAIPEGAPVSEQQSAPYAYSQPSGYGYDAYFTDTAPRSNSSRIILIGVLVAIALCCALACGLLLGFELIPDLLGISGAAVPKPSLPRPTATPQSMLLIFHYLFG